MTQATPLHRQINPSWIQLDRVTSQAFKPTAKDNKRLSVYDGDQIGAQAAWDHYVNELQLRSVGVLAVTKGECSAQELVVQPDPTRFPSHVVMEFGGCSKSQIEAHAKRLTNAARTRGWQHLAEPAE